MTVRNPSDSMEPKLSIVPDQRGAATVNGTGFDRSQFEYALGFVMIGEVATGATLDVKFQDSADNVTFADITGGAFAQVADTGDNETLQADIRLRDKKKFIRAVGVVAGGNVDYGVAIVLMSARYIPEDITETFLIVK